MYTEASKKAVNKYNKKAYDQIPIRVKAGEKEKIIEYAKSIDPDMSLNAYIVGLIERDMNRD